eukprot:TRINITY_DN44617_c0_g1_i1.p2 TRINITY_DN44617_c0_g1~~TRINITY_DN44617_c0_g1_i1.p2  ORF type:complete len:166 (+),score=44.02 TRINITY_DN44617_c0_g1_i1:64-561(+)
MGLTAAETEALRRAYPDRLQVMSKLADIDSSKLWYWRGYFFGLVWAYAFGFFKFSDMFTMSRMSKGSTWNAGIPMFAKSQRRQSLKCIAHMILGFGFTYFCHVRFEQLEDQAAALWSINGVHVGEFKPRSMEYLQENFPDKNEYATVEDRVRVLKMWQNDNAMTT